MLYWTTKKLLKLSNLAEVVLKLTNHDLDLGMIMTIRLVKLLGIFKCVNSKSVED